MTTPDEIHELETLAGYDRSVDDPEPICGACGLIYDPAEGHSCDLAPAGEAAVVGWLLLPTLAQIADLAAVCFNMATSAGRNPHQLTFYGDFIGSDLGTMRLRDFREHYTGGET